MRVGSLMLLILAVLCAGCGNNIQQSTEPANRAAIRVFGKERAGTVTMNLIPDTLGTDAFTVNADSSGVRVTGNSQIALCRGVYDYIRNGCGGMFTWAGTDAGVAAPYNSSAVSPYKYRYYFNVVTHGYSTAYWDWGRWEKEIDWMAMHGINMPLVPGAHEAILRRVFKKLGLTPRETDAYFSGPAHFPWNRMGNLEGWDGPVPEDYFRKQIALTHKMLTRMRELGMTPIVHAFAGFVPPGITRIFPNAQVRELGWGGGLPEAYNGYILSPDSRCFSEIGNLYIKEWEKEFGRVHFFLADSFNEMDVPLSDDPDAALKELAAYGEAVYRSIHEADAEAVWVMQGWTFPFHRDETGKLFWTPERLAALVSRVPDDKVLFLDLANEYNHVFWKIDPSWKTYSGFFNKMWIYSFIPNMGGKTPYNGILDVYASIPVEALNYPEKGNLAGFGFAPEGIENNEAVYELLSDMAWQRTAINLDSWIEKFCVQRYGAYPPSMKKAWGLLRRSCYGTFTDHPIFRFQLRPGRHPRGVENHATVHTSQTFRQAVGAFLLCAPELKHNTFYMYDAIELCAQYLGLIADEKLRACVESGGQGLSEPLQILMEMDRLLASHPSHRLSTWVRFARKWGDYEDEKDYYESNAKRLLTTWGGDPVNDYAGRVWSGLIRDYYVPRWKEFYTGAHTSVDSLKLWEEQWITTPGVSPVKEYDEPAEKAVRLFQRYSAQ